MTVLISLGLCVAYAAWMNGAHDQQDWLYCLLALCLIAIAVFVRAKRSDGNRGGAVRRAVTVLTVAAPLYVIAQAVPLPSAVVGVLSPARAALAELLRVVDIDPGFYALSVHPAKTIEHLLRFVGYALMLLIVRECALRRPDRNWVLVAPLVAVAGIQALAGVSQVFAGEAIAHGTYVDRNHFSGLLEIALPFALAFALSALRSRSALYPLGMGPTLAASGALIVSVLLLTGVLLSLSRAGFMIALLGILQVAAFHFMPAGSQGLAGGRGKLVAVALGLVFLFGFVFLPSDALISRFGDWAATDDITADSRVGMWGETLSLIGDYPLFGCGLGGFPSAFVAYRATSPLHQISFAHNDFLQYFAELGLVGFGLVFGPVVVLGLGLLRRLQFEERTHRRYLALGCLVSLNSLALHSLVEFNLYMPANALAFCWVLGVSAALGERNWKLTR